MRDFMGGPQTLIRLQLGGHWHHQIDTNGVALNFEDPTAVVGQMKSFANDLYPLVKGGPQIGSNQFQIVSELGQRPSRVCLHRVFGY